MAALELLAHLSPAIQIAANGGAGGGDARGGGGGDAGNASAASGLGLATCKGLVEAHGGRIRAESAGIGRGARFTFTLPVAVGEDAGAGAGEAPARPRILVVDDDPHTLRFVRDALTRVGYAVRVTAAPGELAEFLRAERPQLVLLDLMLPGTGGIELMAEVPELLNRPVIFISGYGRDETIARAFEAGAAGYIVKPFSPTELAARVGAALRARAGAVPLRIPVEIDHPFHGKPITDSIPNRSPIPRQTDQ